MLIINCEVQKIESAVFLRDLLVIMDAPAPNPTVEPPLLLRSRSKIWHQKEREPSSQPCFRGGGVYTAKNQTWIQVSKFPMESHLQKPLKIVIRDSTPIFGRIGTRSRSTFHPTRPRQSNPSLVSKFWVGSICALFITTLTWWWLPDETNMEVGLSQEDKWNETVRLQNHRY
jgi:hypothetical protein